MNSSDPRRESFNFRLRTLKNDFWDYVIDQDIKPSDALRNFVKQGLSRGSGSLSHIEKKELLKEIFELKRTLSGIGSNLNQIAHYFNIHDHLIESDLRKTQIELQGKQKELNNLLNKILKSI
jgi:hypothetical protein